MRRSTSLVLICAGFAGAWLSQRAHAADYPTGVYPSARPAAAVTEFVSGWYLRGDVGYRTNIDAGSITSSFPLTSDNIDDVASVGAGAGYKAGWFRADVTVDYAGRAKFTGNGLVPETYNGKIEAWTVLGNLYLDLGTWNGLTPYIGAGAGSVTFRAYDYNSPDGFADKQSHTDFAWSLMAGVAWCFAPRWLVDFSYRRLNMGEAVFNQLRTNELTLNDLTANEFRIGLRYNFD